MKLAIGRKLISDLKPGGMMVLSAVAMLLASGAQASSSRVSAQTPQPIALRALGSQNKMIFPRGKQSETRTVRNSRVISFAQNTDSLVWLQNKTAASNGASGDYYGSAVAISGNGNIALVGASGQDNGQGVAYVLGRSNTGWQQVATLIPANGEAGERFGSALALSADGMTALVGAWNKTVNGTAEEGAAYVFTTSDNWSTHTQAAELTASDGSLQYDFGNGVAISANGTTALVGAPGGGSKQQGTAYVFTSADNRRTYPQTAELVATDVLPGDSFGIGVSLSAAGAFALIGAPGKAVNSNASQGAAYVFALNSGSWTQVTELTANDGVAGDVLGNTMALSPDGTTALVSAIGKNNLQGAAYVFTTTNGWTAYTQAAELTASNGAKQDEFGYSAALSGDGTALIGSPFANIGNNIGEGAAYIFKNTGGTWSQTSELAASDGVPYDSSASTVAISDDGTTEMIGSGCHPYDLSTNSCGPGAAYLFGSSSLSAALDAPATVETGANFQSRYIVTNASATTSPPVEIELPVPGTSVSYVSSSSSQGNCSYDGTRQVATCNLGNVAGNGGTAWAALTLKATATANVNVSQNGKIANGTPDLSQTAVTAIQQGTGGSGGGGSGSGSSSGGGAFNWLSLLALLAIVIVTGSRLQTRRQI